MSTPEIRTLVCANLSAGKILYIFPNDNHTSEAQLILARLQSRGMSTMQREKISTNKGLWNCTLNKGDIALLALTNEDYSERHVFALLNVEFISLRKLIQNYRISVRQLHWKMEKWETR